jgi:type IV secretion system protein VirB1
MGAAMIPPALLACAPNVAPITLQAIARVESRDNPLAIHVNGIREQPPPASSAQRAARVAETYIARGYSVDIGLMQVNSRHLAVLGVSLEQILDPCTNIRAAATILTADYAAAARTRGDGQSALQLALSAYNTGNFYQGFANGYVTRYYGPGGVPILSGTTHEASVTRPAASLPPPSNPYTAGTTVFAREATNVRIE